MFKELPQMFAKHQKRNLLHLLTQTVSTNILLPDPLVQKRLNIHDLNSGPQRAKEDAFEKQLAGRWHIISLQEASEYASHDILTGRFHVTHYERGAIFFNKDTFLNIDVKSINPHDIKRHLLDRVMEGDQGWVTNCESLVEPIFKPAQLDW